MSPAHGVWQQGLCGSLAVRHQRGAMCTTRRTGICASRAVQKGLLPGVAAYSMAPIGIVRLCESASRAVCTTVSSLSAACCACCCLQDS
jgi:hypothetical protein